MLDRMLKKVNEGEIFIQTVRGKALSTERGSFEHVVEYIETGVGVRVVKKGKVGFSFGPVSKFEQIVKAAERAARVGGKSFGLPTQGKYTLPRKMWDKRLIEFKDSDIIERVKLMIDTIKEKKTEPSNVGLFTAELVNEIGNTNGMRHTSRGTQIEYGAFVTLGTISGLETGASRLDDVDFLGVAENAAQMALDSRKPIAISGGEMEIILRPRALGGDSGLLPETFVPSVNGDNVRRGISWCTGKVGKKVFAADVNITDNGLLEGGLNSWPGDFEGIPCGATTIVEDGVLKNLLYDWETAAKVGAAATGNGFREYSKKPTIKPTNLTIGAGGASEEELIAEVKKGLLVNWVSGSHTANEVSGDFSVEVKNAFVIENGRITKPVKSGMISGNIFEVLNGVKANNSRQLESIIAPSIRTKLMVTA